jgi:hypothetical protein
LCDALNIENGMARGPEFPKVRHVAVSDGERSGGADAVIVAFEAAQPEPREPSQGAPEGALAAAAAEPALHTGAQAAAPSATGAPPSPPVQPTTIARIVAVDVGRARSDDETCRAPDDSLVGVDGKPVRCPNSAAGLEHAGVAAAWATHLGEAVLLDGIDRWYRLGATAAGFCRSCELALVETLRESYGDHLQPFDPLAPQRAQPASRAAPFAGAREALRLASAVEATKRAALRARDEARRARGVEMAVLGRVGTLTALGLAVCRHLDGLVFDLPSLDPEEAVLPLLAVRAALGLRPAVGVLRADATAEQVRLFAALALACDADVMLPSTASAEALAALEQHRKFEDVVRERFRPSEPLLDLEVLVSPFAEHWGGAHLRTASACAAALGRAHLLLGARLDLAEPRAHVLLLAGCSALSAEDGARARRHVQSGGDALVVGKCATCDEEGRPGPLVFPEAKSGMERVGEGRVYALESASESPQADAAQVVRAARELLGRGRSHLSVSGRARLFARAYLDPERKLDVHLVNLDAPRPAQGVLLHIAGQAAGAGRTGYWFAPERAAGKDGERIALNPSGFSVSTVLPGISAGALLAVPR